MDKTAFGSCVDWVHAQHEKRGNRAACSKGPKQSELKVGHRDEFVQIVTVTAQAVKRRKTQKRKARLLAA